MHRFISFARPRFVRPILAGIILLARFAEPASAHPPAAEMADAAKNLLATLNPDQKAKAVYELKNEERFDWHFIPKPRKGLPIAEMTPSQRNLAHALLCSGLSQRGFIKASTIMSLEQVLFDIEKQTGPKRDSELYYFTVFGTPGESVWAWRVEGHHVSLNFTIAGDEVLGVTPSFLGANPAEVREGPRKGLRVLGAEEDLGRSLVKSLDPSQLKTALISSNAPKEIITGNDRKAHRLDPVGISSVSLTPGQKPMLLAILKEYLSRYPDQLAEADFKELTSDSAALYFAWAGGLEVGQPHYYRVQGPTFLMEYDNTQNGANHVHSVWRDLRHDFGGDPLREHYETAPHGK